MRVLLPAEYKEQLAVAEKLYEVQAPLRAAQAEEDATEQHEPPLALKPLERTWVLGTRLTRMEAKLDGVKEAAVQNLVDNAEEHCLEEL